MVPATAAQKREFAIAWLRFDDTFRAAMVATGDDALAAIHLQRQLSGDPEVLALREQLLDEYGEEAFLPTKAEAARAIWQLSENERADFRDRVAAKRLFVEVMGYVAKADTPLQVNTNGGAVMIVKDHGTDDEWRAKAAAQQKRLMSEAKTVTAA